MTPIPRPILAHSLRPLEGGVALSMDVAAAVVSAAAPACLDVCEMLVESDCVI